MMPVTSFTATRRRAAAALAGARARRFDVRSERSEPSPCAAPPAGPVLSAQAEVLRKLLAIEPESIRVLAEVTGWQLEAFNRALQELTESGIAVLRHQPVGPSLYHLTDRVAQ